MNRYIAKQELIVRTQGGKRVKLEAGKYYDGGFDFRNLEKNQSVVFVKVDGRNDEVIWPAGEEFVSKFKYLSHVDNVEYTKVEVVKRNRIAR